MKPLAKLSLIRQRLYKKSCSADHDDVPFQEASADFYDDHGNYFCFLLLFVEFLGCALRNFVIEGVVCQLPSS